MFSTLKNQTTQPKRRSDMRVYMMFLAVFMAIASAVAEEVPMINNSGIVQLMKTTETWRPLSQEERQAMDNPGQEVPINMVYGNVKRLDFWHLTPVMTYKEVKVFTDGQIQTISKTGTIDGQPIIATYVVFVVMAMVCMLVSNILMMGFRNKPKIAEAFIALLFATAFTVFAVTGVVATFGASVFAVTFSASVFAITCSTLVLVAFAFASRDPEYFKIHYLIVSIMFYAFSIVAIWF